MPTVSKTRGSKVTVNVVFAEGEDGADACYEELTAKYSKKTVPKSKPTKAPKKKKA